MRDEPLGLSDLRALYVNCTLSGPRALEQGGAHATSTAIMERNGVDVDASAPSTTSSRPGSGPHMREHGAVRDDWPELYERVQAADILVLGSPIWLGEKSSICTRVVERLYACSSLLNEHGQYAYYGKVGGCLITGNEDGIKHCSMNILYSLQHLGYTIPPQADAGWIGEAGPGPSLSRRGLGRARERLHEPEHDVHDLEPAPCRATAEGRRRGTGARQSALAVGRRLPLRLREPGLPLKSRWRPPRGA